ncbi:MAG: c-type cytochrome [Gammaproteobacteria bacterium]|nr:c-type cytochrome [Gammaproteobacteria bacterium]MDH3465811.1 c-type cytochrome [Gammaproteobacteria bacterium]
MNLHRTGRARRSIVTCIAAIAAWSGGAIVYADGKSVYERTCVACDGAGVAGAPRTGDIEAWKSRIGTGMEALVASVINGVQGYTGMMPPRGGNPDLSDADIDAAVTYMVDESQ